MNIINQSKDVMTMMEKYALTKNPLGKSMKEAVGQVIELDSWMIYQDKNSKDEDVEILAIRTKEGDVFRTISETFINAFVDIIDLACDMEEDIKAIKPVSGMSKSGREYITCVLAEL